MDLARKEKKDLCDKYARVKRQMNLDKNIVRKNGSRCIFLGKGVEEGSMGQCSNLICRGISRFKGNGKIDTIVT